MKIIALADADSYVKWAAAVLTRVPADWDVALMVVRTAKEPSAEQLRTALIGSRLESSSVVRHTLDDAVTVVASERPDIVLVATIGPLADLVTEAVLAACDVPPVIATGLPGIGLPARRKALVYRSQANLVILHSKREIREFAAIALHNGFRHQFALATLPFLETVVPGAVAKGDVIFAAQAIVPRSRPARVRVLRWLVDYAERYPQHRVVIKVRATTGEEQTHPERIDYPSLLRAEFTVVPSNLVVESGPMGPLLRSAAALVTVSSTAVLEAVALDVPAIVLDDFGVGPDLLNEVFLGSGLLAGSEELLAGDFRFASESWLDDNYFHDEAAQSWHADLLALVELNRAGLLLRPSRHVRGRGGMLRRAWDRKRVLGRFDRRPLGYVALAIGTPARLTVLALHALRELAADDPPRRAVPLQHETPAFPGRRDDPAPGD